MTTREQVIEEARKWINTRYQHQARVKGLGVDCINLIVGVAEATGILPKDFNMAEFNGYSRTPNPKVLIGACDRFMTRIAKEDALPGDVLIIRFVDDPQHFAFLTRTDPHYMLHSYANARKVTEHIIDSAWSSKIIAAYRFIGLEN